MVNGAIDRFTNFDRKAERSIDGKRANCDEKALKIIPKSTKIDQNPSKNAPRDHPGVPRGPEDGHFGKIIEKVIFAKLSQDLIKPVEIKIFGRPEADHVSLFFFVAFVFSGQRQVRSVERGHLFFSCLGGLFFGACFFPEATRHDFLAGARTANQQSNSRALIEIPHFHYLVNSHYKSPAFPLCGKNSVIGIQHFRKCGIWMSDSDFSI